MVVVSVECDDIRRAVDVGRAGGLQEQRGELAVVGRSRQAGWRYAGGFGGSIRCESSKAESRRTEQATSEMREEAALVY